MVVFQHPITGMDHTQRTTQCIPRQRRIDPPTPPHNAVPQAARCASGMEQRLCTDATAVKHPTHRLNSWSGRKTAPDQPWFRWLLNRNPAVQRSGIGN